MKVDKPAALRVIVALSVVVLFTGGVHELRKSGGGAPDFPCQESDSKDVTISIGCTGGKHRSVAIAEEIASQLSSNDRSAYATHRDVGRE